MNSKRLSIALLILVALLTISDVLLIRQNLQMRKLLPAERSALKPGAQLPPFAAKSLLDQPVDVHYDGSGPKHIYFYFTPPCKFCRQQFAYWNEILKESGKQNLDVLGLV